MRRFGGGVLCVCCVWCVLCVCVCVVFAQEEAWAEGMEWEIVDFLTSVYGTLVFGDTRGGDGSILPHAAGAAAAAAAAAAQAQGQGQGGGFGSMTQWHGQGHGQGRKAPPPPLTATTQLPALQGDNGSGDHPGMISDFPRQVRGLREVAGCRALLYTC